MLLGFPSRTRRTHQRPLGPYVLALDAAQAEGLVVWYPGEFSRNTLGRKRLLLSATGTFNTWGKACPNPCRGSFPDNNQSGGNSLGLRFNTGGERIVSADSAITVAMWCFKRDALTADGRGLCRIGEDGIDTWSIATTSGNGTVRSAVVTTSGGATQYTAAESAAVFAAQTWFHVATVWRPGDGLYTYVDGRLATSVSVAGTTGLRGTTIFGFYGAINTAFGSDNGWNGAMCNVGLWDRALTESQVEALYAPQTRWDLYWRPSTRVYVSVSDVGGGGATGPLIGGPLVGRGRLGGRLVA